ncbi:MAG TPA: alpha/beta fold hydrolase, partial [Mycobacteriales bacterium]|nr:alpha/beta fold hydrolase [Mycobacteriales bacterium]
MSWSAVRRRHSGRPVAVVLHGVGSTGEFARRCLAAPLGSLGYDVVAPDLRGHASAGSCRDPAAHSVGSHLVDLQALAEQVDVRLVAGISLGAELALRWSAEHPRLDGVVLCLPGLTGPTTVAAAANRHVADRVAREGVEPVLAELARDPAALPW